jgi:hypothetical protein
VTVPKASRAAAVQRLLEGGIILPKPTLTWTWDVPFGAEDLGCIDTTATEPGQRALPPASEKDVPT